VQQSYLCPRCGYPVVFGIRFCGNCGTPLTWSAKQSNRGHFTFISLAVVAVLVVVLVTGIIIELNSPSPMPVSSTVSKPVPQPQSVPPSVPQSLTLATPILLSPGINTDPGQTVDTLTPSLQWNKVTNADYYSLTISRFPYDADNTVCTPARLEGTSLTIPGGLLEYGQKYRWAIEAHNNSNVSSVSNVLYFQTPQPPSNPSPTVPSNQQASIPASPPMSKPPWAPVNLPGFSP
jgi:hypothetical protein